MYFRFVVMTKVTEAEKSPTQPRWLVLTGAEAGCGDNSVFLGSGLSSASNPSVTGGFCF